jgi:Flp pilus assembly protein TadG
MLDEPGPADMHELPGRVLRLNAVCVQQLMRAPASAAIDSDTTGPDSTDDAPASAASAPASSTATAGHSTGMRSLMAMRQRGKRGAVLIETAMAFFIFLMLLFGLVEMGRAWFSYNMLTYAVREGARLAAVKPALRRNDSAVVGRISAILRDGGMTPASATVTFQAPLDPGDLVRVAAEVRFSPVIALWVTGGRVTFPLRVDVITRYEV